MQDLTRRVEFFSYDPIADQLAVHIRTQGTLDGQPINFLNTQGVVMLGDDVVAALKQLCLDALEKQVLPPLAVSLEDAVTVAPSLVSATLSPPTPSPLTP